MPCRLPESYPPPDKRNTPRLSSQFFKQRKLARKPIEIDESIASQLKLVSTVNLKRVIESLANFPNRHSKSENIHKVADYLQAELTTIGYSDNVHFHEYEEGNYRLKNIICDKRGSIVGDADATLLFCAHYDTILMHDLEDAKSIAPGADDNASGVSALVEIARIISGLELKHNVRFAFFSGEEQGLWGSKNYAQHMQDVGEKIYCVINMDMCAEPKYLPYRTTYVDVDDGTTGVDSTNDGLSLEFGNKMEQMAKDYADLKVKFDPIFASDYMPFEARGYVCIGGYDGSAVEGNSHYHNATDVLENLDLDFLTSVVRMVLAFALNETR
jgi:Peptidase family M28